MGKEKAEIMGIKLSATNDNFRSKIDPGHRKELGAEAMTFSEADATRIAKLEKEIQNQIADYLNQNGILFIRPRMDKKSPLKKGWPDFTFAIHGIAYAMEVKTDTGELSEDQKKIHPKLIAAPNGWKVILVRSTAEAIHLIKEKLYGKRII